MNTFKDYGMSLEEEECRAWAKPKAWQLPACSNAENYGNILRFITDAPTEDELNNQIEASPLIKSNILTENLIRNPFVYNGCPVIAVFTNKTIYPGEILAFGYGGIYWEVRNANRIMLNKKGGIIGHIEGTKVVLEADYEPTKEMTVARADVKELRKVLQSVIINPTLEMFDYKKRFIENINFALSIFQNRYAEYAPEHIFLKKLTLNFAAKESTDEKFKILNSQLKSDEFKQVENNLKALKAEIIVHMNKYNKGKTAQAEVVTNKSTAPMPRKS